MICANCDTEPCACQRTWRKPPVPRVLGAVAAEDFFVRRAMRRWIAGEGPIEALLDEEYAREQAAGRIRPEDRERYYAYKRCRATEAAARAPQA